MKQCRILKRNIILSILFLIPALINAQSNGIISGKVIDKLTQKPLPGTNIILEGTNKGVVADSDGLFRITGIELKTYNIVFTIIGYTSETLYNIAINSGNENNVNVELEPKAVL